MFPAGKVTEGTEGIDIVPTLADALGVADRSGVAGHVADRRSRTARAATR